MKNYLELVPLYTKAHKKQNRMSVFCIFLSVFLVATIFGMADMYIRSMILKTKREDGNWHIALSRISDEDAALIAARPEVKALSCYGTLNYRLDMGYTIAGKDVVICGADKAHLTDIFAGTITEGSFPQSENEILVTGNVKKELQASIGDRISICNADGTESSYTISGFAEDLPMILSKDIYGAFMNTAGFRDFYPGITDGEPDDYSSCFRACPLRRHSHDSQQLKQQYCRANGILRNAALHRRHAEADYTLGAQGSTLSVYLCHPRKHPLKCGCHLDIVRRTAFPKS